MASPLDTLSAEHALIREFLDNLTLAADQLAKGGRPPPQFFRMAVRFAREFADTFHHFKEEYIMFVRLAQKNNGLLDAEIEGLRHQHDRGREYVAEMWRAIEGYGEGKASATERMLESLAAYTALVRHHIHREDHLFYPAVWQALSQSEIAELEAEFDAFGPRSGKAAFEGYHALVCDMGVLLVERPPEA